MNYQRWISSTGRAMLKQAESLNAERFRSFLRFSRRKLAATGVLPWGTKSFECWTLLMVGLSLVRPRSLVELGSGRSTQYLSEYAVKTGASYVSIEQSRIYTHKINRGVRLSLLDGRFVHRVRLDPDGWYSREQLDQLVPASFDFLFVDGPVGVSENLGQGLRVCPRADKWLTEKASSTRFMVVDDLQRQDVRSQFDLLLAASSLRPLFLYYKPLPSQENVLGIAVSEDHSNDLETVARRIGIPVAAEFPLGFCAQR